MRPNLTQIFDIMHFLFGLLWTKFQIQSVSKVTQWKTCTLYMYIKLSHLTSRKTSVREARSTVKQHHFSKLFSALDQKLFSTLLLSIMVESLLINWTFSLGRHLVMVPATYKHHIFFFSCRLNLFPACSLISFQPEDTVQFTGLPFNENI